MAENRSALVVDDERDIRELLVMALGRMGLRCDTALNPFRSAQPTAAQHL
jgi:two-component system response regulator PilR (NtrC family)